MNHALLAELQRLSAYPSVTVLLNTTPADPMRDDDVRRLDSLISDAERRLADDRDAVDRDRVVASLRALLLEAALQPATRAVALCASPDYRAVVRLGREVRDRVVVDDTFATRDMVADLNRTAVFRVITVSDRKARVLIGDRNRLAELRDDRWPLVRDEEESPTAWQRTMTDALEAECLGHDIPTVLAGVARTMRDVQRSIQRTPIATITGGHDRTGWAELHRLAWPLVVDWMRQDGQRAMQRLEDARGARRFAGGLDEVWSLAHDGRVQLLVVEEGYDVPARLDDGRLVPTSDALGPGVIDDAVDELIEAVLLRGGEAVIVPSDTLADHDRVAAVLRY
jgi:hypothetical protein